MFPLSGGTGIIGVRLVEPVTLLRQTEPVALDRSRLGALFDTLGPNTAEDVVCRAMEELALRLTQIDRSHGIGDLPAMRKDARALAAIADQMGMATLARVGRDLVVCLDRGDAVAVGAVLARLLRSGERSLTAVWDMQDLSL